MVAPGMYDYKPPKRTRWQRLWDWVRYDVPWETILYGFLGLLLAGVLGLIGWVIFKPEPGDLMSDGIVIDKGAVRPGKYSGKYSYWIEVESNEVKGTWYISDTYYERVSIGDYVVKGILPEEVTADAADGT